VPQITGFSSDGNKYTILFQIFKHGLLFFKNRSGFQRNGQAEDLTFFQETV
jgi:hypothetical protein